MAGRPRCAFCRLPRGAVACEAAKEIPAPNSSLSRPFIVVSAARVWIVQYRYAIAGPIPAGVWAFESTDRGDHFDPGTKIGTIPFTRPRPRRSPPTTPTTEASAWSTPAPR